MLTWTWAQPSGESPAGLGCAVVLLAALAVTGCGQTEGVADPATVGSGNPPVVLISIDTLRADHLPAYGYSGISTPAIDRLASDSLRFEHAFTHAPTTLPAHTSLLTGLLPSRHGVHDNVGYSLAPDIPTLASVLRAGGYRTGAAISAFPLRGATGLSRGFDRYDDVLDARAGAGIGEIQRAGKRTVEQALGWMRQQPEAGWFLFVHLYEPHEPYAAPEPWASRYPSAYDAEIAYADDLVGRLLDAVRERGLYDKALVILVGDHGESLGEHGEETHGIFVYRSTLQVPLFVKMPAARTATVVQDPAQLVDMMPTVLQTVGLPVPEGLPGASLRDLADGIVPARRIYAESYSPRLHFGWSELLSVIDYPMQYIDAPRAELYDLAGDPDERHNLLGARPGVAGRLRGWLSDRRVEPQAPTRVDAEARDRLAALGYVSGLASPPETERPDPKDRIHLLSHLKDAAALFFGGRYAEAIGEYESALQESPAMAAAWEYLGRAQLALGRNADAASSFQMLGELGADTADTQLVLGQIYLGLGRLQEAATAANVAEIEQPAAARTLLARVELARGDATHAATLLRSALAAEPDFGPAERTFAELMLQTSPRDPAAVEHAEAALAAADEPQERSEVALLLGRILMAQGRADEAERAFEKSIESYPANLMAHGYLAVHYFRLGRPQYAIQVLRHMAELNPGPQTELWAIDVLRQANRATDAEQWRRRAAAIYPRRPEFRVGIE